MHIKIKKLREDAKLPTHGHPGDAGIDFYAVETIVFQPGKQNRVPTGVSVEIPEAHVGLIWDKSSLSFNKGLKVMGGVIDSGYRGEIFMSLLNTSNEEVVIEKGHKIAQMLIQKFEHCDILEVTELSDTARGEGREGSTGHK
ncbi:MAG TPA: dUTP diphosphatase [Candidatus Paceibacterota bacterium]|nr:dUTP diphosphatase [Candidatus Paceibacterota bacterium]